MSKYAKGIFPNKEKVEKEMIVDATEDAKIEMMNAIGGAEKAIRASIKKVKYAQYSVPFSPAGALQAQLELEDAQDNLDRLKKMQTDMF